MKDSSIYAIMLIGVILVLQCTNEEPAGINPPDENPGISGILYANDGSASKNVSVHIRKKSCLADTSGSVLTKTMVSSLSTLTDGNGRFSFKTELEPDMYVIEANSYNTAVFIDSINIQSPTSIVKLEADTLKPMGAIKGLVKLSYGGLAQKIYVLIFGIDRFVNLNEDGSFIFPDLAEGNYTIRFVSGLNDYEAVNVENVIVHAADTTDMQTINLPYRGIPIPQNITILYDTLHQRVTLSWSKLDSSIVNGYNVYRRNVDSNSIFQKPLNYRPVNDTAFIDSSGEQDLTYEYKVTAINNSGKESVKSNSRTATIASYLTTDTIIKINVGDYSSIADISCNSDEIFVSENLYPRIQVFDSAMHYRRQICDGTFAAKRISAMGDTVFAVKMDVKSENSQTVYTDSIFAFSSMGILISKMAGPEYSGDIYAKLGKLYFTGQYSIYIYATNGTLEKSLPVDAKPSCRSVFVSDSNSIFFGTNSKVVKVNNNGDPVLDLTIPNGTINDIVYDSDRQILFVACNYLTGYSYKYSKMNGLVYAFDKNLSEIAEYWLWNIKGANISLAIQNNGCLLIAVGGEQNKIIKLNPLKK